MFITLAHVATAIKELESVHPFYGGSFLVFKEGRLPVGTTVTFPVDAQDKQFLDRYYRPAAASQWYFRVFRVSDKQKSWNDPKYASSGSQSTRTRGAFANALIHEKNTKIWGWQPDYVEVLKAQLKGRKRIPAFYLAVWLYREREWSADATPVFIVESFLRDFNITDAEQQALFDVSVPQGTTVQQLFQDQRISWNDLRQIIGSPPDMPIEEGGTLVYLHVQGVGPARELTFRPAERLNVITGDNGLGKTFLLECIWWALTDQWAGLAAYPRSDARGNDPKITFQISGDSLATKPVSVSYDWQTQSWPPSTGRPTIPGLLIYARVDGSFAVWDPAKNLGHIEYNGEGTVRGLVFSRDDLWRGVEGRGGAYIINGLVRDWVDWQNTRDTSPFDVFRKVLRRLSPPQLLSDLGALEPGEPVRLPDDTRPIPTLKHPYGQVPIVHAAAGVRRIVTLAYLIAWAWEEHKINSSLMRREPQKRLVIMVDEIEEHLHPQWQRVILPAVLGVAGDLSGELQVQLVVATHSPLAMASVEPVFDPSLDKLFHLDIEASESVSSPTSNAVLKELPFIRYGPVDAWLTSDVFELRQARSIEAETAIEKAKQLQQNNPDQVEVEQVSLDLQKYLASDDEFWPRWIYYAKQHGVRL